MAETSFQPPRVLVVDDDPMSNLVTVLLVESGGYEVVAVDNGADAIAAVERDQFALIFMDIVMCGMDGYQTLAIIRGQERPGSRIPVLALTGLGDPGDLDHWLEQGFDGHLSKPINLNELRGALNRYAGPVLQVE